MESILRFVVDNWDMMVTIFVSLGGLVGVDTVLGWLPNSMLKYKGLFLTIVRKLLPAIAEAAKKMQDYDGKAAGGVVSVLLLALFVACAGVQRQPSVCDDLTDSFLCATVQKVNLEMGINMRLEDAGRALTLANSAAIATGQYTKADALIVVDAMLAVLSGDAPSFETFGGTLKEYSEKYPGLFDEVVGPYISEFVAYGGLIPAGDLGILRDYFGKRRAALS